jgi:hypothetical protein
MIPVPRLSVIREAGDSHVFGAGREIRAEPAQGQARVWQRFATNWAIRF